MKTIAIITARRGSKRIPRKNIKDFLGKPIIYYSIEAAINSGCFNTVMVSTDDTEIADISKKYGAEVPFMRSAANSNDYATTSDVVKEVIKEYEKREQYFDYFCCIYPTAPLITSDRLKEAMNLIIEKDCDSLLPIVKFSFPPQRCVVIENDKVIMKWPEYMVTRSQDLQPLYHDCGQFYIMKVDKFHSNHKFITDNTIPFLMSEIEVQDIDNEEDWKIAEMKYKIINGVKNDFL